MAVKEAAAMASVLTGHQVGPRQNFQGPEGDILKVADGRSHQVEPGRQQLEGNDTFLGRGRYCEHRL